MEFQQYYPTYNYKERDIVIAEFEEAQKIANTQSKLYGQLANFLIAFVTIGITLLLKTSETSTNQAILFVKDNVLLFDMFIAAIAIVILRYFIEIQKTIVINCRKVITLRRMLGLDYGHLQLTIPNWRVEGATNPFVVKLFPGWFKFSSSPFWVVVLTLNVFWYLSIPSVNYHWVTAYWYIISSVITLIYAYNFRIQLKETHETFYLIVIKNISRILGYSELSSFSRSFKKRKGISPTKFKKIVNT